MATKVVGGIVANLVANTKAWTRGFNKANKDVKKFESGLASAAKKIAAFAAGYIAVRRIATALSATAAEMDKVAKTSDKLGVATEKLIGMQHAANLTGVGVEQLHKGLQNMTRVVSEAAAGTGEAKDALDKLGISAAELNQLSPDEQFIAIAEGVNKVASNNERLAATMDIFGMRASGLLNTLRQGEKGIRDMMMEAEALGATFTREQARKVEAARDTYARFEMVLRGALQKTMIELAPMVNLLIKRITKWATQTGAVEAMVKKLAGALHVVVSVAGSVNKVIQGLALVWNTVATAAKMAVAAIVKGLSWGASGLSHFARGLDFVHAGWLSLISVAKHAQIVFIRATEGASDARLWQIAKLKAEITETNLQIQRLFDGTDLVGDTYKAKLDSIADQLDNTALDIAMSTIDNLDAIDQTITDMTAKSWSESIREFYTEWQTMSKDTAEAVIADTNKIAGINWQQMKKEQDIRKQNYDFITSGLKDIVSNTNMSAKEQFKINKAFALSDIAMKTASAIIGYHAMTPPRPGMAIAAGIIGAAQFAAVAAQQFDGGGSGVSASAASTAMDSAESEPSRVVNINVAEGGPSRGFIESLMGGIQEAVGDGVRFNIGTT